MGETQTAARGRPYVILRERQGCEAGGETWGDTDRRQRQAVRHTAGEAGVRHGETQTAARGRPYVILRGDTECEAGSDTWGRHRPPPGADRTSYCGETRSVRQGVRHGETQTTARGRPSYCGRGRGEAWGRHRPPPEADRTSYCGRGRGETWGRHRQQPEEDRTSYCGRGRGVRQGVRHGGDTDRRQRQTVRHTAGEAGV